jgi:hypothetical protein
MPHINHMTTSDETLNLADGADGEYQSVCFLSCLSIDEIIGRHPLTCILSKTFNINPMTSHDCLQ